MNFWTVCPLGSWPKTDCWIMGGGWFCGVGVLLLESFEFAFDGGFGGRGHAVYEEDAVEVVHFVLDGSGEESFGLEGDGVAIEVTSGDFDPRWA